MDAPDEAERPPRRIVIIIDGSGCSATEVGRNRFSNAFRVGTALRGADGRQVVFYFPGPGSRRVPLHKLNGITGVELKQIVTEAYLAICNNLSGDGRDELYLFGYSRGAIAAKVLAHLVCTLGVLDSEHFALMKHVWAVFTGGGNEHKPFLVNRMSEMPVRFVGTFDAVHGPRSALLNLVPPRELHPGIEAAVELLALDEGRVFFKPHVWVEASGEAPTPDYIKGSQKPDSPRRLQQIWMPGAHSDVGDHASRSLIADFAFLTMMERVCARTKLAINKPYVTRVFQGVLASERRILIHTRRWPVTIFRRKLPRTRATEIHPLFEIINGKWIGSKRRGRRYVARTRISTADFEESGYVFDIEPLLMDYALKGSGFGDPDSALRSAAMAAMSDAMGP